MKKQLPGLLADESVSTGQTFASVAGWPEVQVYREEQRMFSSLPENTVYAGPQSKSATNRVTLRTIRQKYLAGDPLSMVTAYDYPSAVHVRTLIIWPEIPKHCMQHLGCLTLYHPVTSSYQACHTHARKVLGNKERCKDTPKLHDTDTYFH